MTETGSVSVFQNMNFKWAEVTPVGTSVATLDTDPITCLTIGSTQVLVEFASGQRIYPTYFDIATVLQRSRAADTFTIKAKNAPTTAFQEHQEWLTFLSQPFSVSFNFGIPMYYFSHFRLNLKELGAAN